MCKITEGIWKIRFQLQSHPIRGNSFRNASRVLIDGCQVTVGVCKGWVDLDGPSVALHSPLHVLHLFQRVTHVTEGIGKVRVDTEQT